MRLVSSLLCSIAVVGGVAFQASATTYTVGQTISTAGHVTGTIVTDGTIGTLATANITGWNLVVQGGSGASIVLTNANSVFGDAGASFSATSSSLSFNYSGSSGNYMIFQLGGIGGGSPYWCNATTSGLCYQGATAAPIAYNDATTQTESRSGVQVIASVAATPTATVPEPASWAMMVGGFGMIGGAMRRRHRTAVRFA